MPVGLTSRVDLLCSSPFDQQQQDEHSVSPTTAPDLLSHRWVPSRYTVRAETTDGRLVLWNTFTGELTVFQDASKARIQRMLKPGGIEGRRQGAIGFLADRGYLVEAGTNEYRDFQYAFGRQHYDTDRLHLLLLASEDCNLRCKYCYEEFARGTMAPWVRTAIKRYLQKRIGGIRQLFLEWFGGEPLYGYAAMEDIAPFARQLAEEYSVSYVSKITTNGYLLSSEVVDHLLSWKVLGFQITVDGPPEYHDRNRPTRDGRGTFSTIFANLTSLQKRPDQFSVNLRVNFDRENSPEIHKFLDLARSQFGGDSRFRLSFRPINRLGGMNDPQLNVCGSDESLDIDLQLREAARTRGLNLVDSIHQARGLGSQVCYAARPYSFLIGGTGKVMKCTVDLDTKGRNVVGHLNEDGEMHLNDDKMALWTEPAFEQDNKCQSCVILPACQGITCPVRRWERQKPPCPPLRSAYKVEMRQAAGDYVLPSHRATSARPPDAKEESSSFAFSVTERSQK